MSVISDASNKVVATITAGNSPAGISYDSGAGEVFVAIFFSNNVSVISEASKKAVATVSTGSGPEGVAYDSGTGEVFVANALSNSVSVISDGTRFGVTFTETGLSFGTNWSVTVNEEARSSTSNTTDFLEPNGNYTFTVAPVSGYTASPSSGTVEVRGTAASVIVAFSPSGGGSSTGFLGLPGVTGYYLIGGIVSGAFIVAMAAVILRSRRH